MLDVQRRPRRDKQFHVLRCLTNTSEQLRSTDARVDVRPEQVLVILDDFLLDFGRVRVRRAGSDGGHNGLASVLEKLTSTAVPRLRMGIGPVPEGDEDIDFVLSSFASDEDVGGLVERGCQAAECLLTDGVEAAMNRFNGCPALE